MDTFDYVSSFLSFYSYYTMAKFGSSREMNLSHNEPNTIPKIPQNIPIVSAVTTLNV